MKYIPLLLLLSVSLLRAEGTPVPLVLSKLQLLLKGAGLPYRVMSDGTPVIDVATEGGGKEQVAVLGENQYGNYSMRAIICMIYSGEEKPSDAIILDALSESSNMTSSRFQIVYLPDKRWGLSVVGLFPDSGDSTTLKKLIEGIGTTTANFKKKHGIKIATEFIPSSSKATPTQAGGGVDKSKVSEDVKQSPKEKAENFEIAFQVAFEDEEVSPIPKEAQDKMQKEFGKESRWYVNKKKDIIIVVNSSNPLKVEVSMEFLSVQAHPDILAKMHEVCKGNDGMLGKFHESPKKSKNLHLFYTIVCNPSADNWQDITASSIFALKLGDKVSDIFRKKK